MSRPMATACRAFETRKLVLDPFACHSERSEESRSGLRVNSANASILENRATEKRVSIFEQTTDHG